MSFSLGFFSAPETASISQIFQSDAVCDYSTIDSHHKSASYTQGADINPSILTEGLPKLFTSEHSSDQSSEEANEHQEQQYSPATNPLPSYPALEYSAAFNGLKRSAAVFSDEQDIKVSSRKAKTPSSARRLSTHSSAGSSPEGEEDKRAVFLERNRVAAAKCRIKKKEWIDNLEAAAKQGSRQTRELQALATHLREEILTLRTQLSYCSCGNTQIQY